MACLDSGHLNTTEEPNRENRINEPSQDDRDRLQGSLEIALPHENEPSQDDGDRLQGSLEIALPHEEELDTFLQEKAASLIKEHVYPELMF